MEQVKKFMQKFVVFKV